MKFNCKILIEVVSLRKANSRGYDSVRLTNNYFFPVNMDIFVCQTSLCKKNTH